MIVPFIFNLYEYANEKPMFLWIFYKYINFCMKYNMPIIAQEDMFIDPEKYKKINHSATKENLLHYKIPNIDEVNSIVSEKILKNDEANILRSYKNTYEGWISILEKRNNDFEKIINRCIDNIIEKKHEKIEAIITWVSFPSLIYCCKKKNIKLIQMELSSIREQSVYNTTLGYFCFDNKYSYNQVERDYKQISKENYNIFSRKELLALFLKKEYIKKYITEIDNPEYFDFGIGFGLKNDPYEEIYSKYSEKEILKKVGVICTNKAISVRSHPAYPHDLSKYGYIVDKSSNSFEWILKCKRIITNVSNVGYEAMLIGKTSYVLSENMPFGYLTINELDSYEDYIVDLKYLNYITFGFYVPYDLMFNIDYIKFRLNNPSIIDIYNYNLNYILKQKKIENIFNKKDKLSLILYKNLGFHNDEIEYIKNYNCYSLVNDLNMEIKNKQDTIEKMNNDINIKDRNIIMLNNELQSIINSKGWKFLDKLRRIKSKFTK